MEARLTTHSTGRPKGSTLQSVKQRRANVYRLWLMGWSETEIGEAYGLDQSIVSRDLEAVRRQRTQVSKPARERYKDLIHEIYDKANLSLKEAWRCYVTETKPEVRAVFLGRVQAGIGLMTRFIPDLSYLQFELDAEKMEAQIAELWRDMEEKQQLEKIHSITHP